MKRQPGTWDALQRVVRELNDLMPLLTSKAEPLTGRDRESHIYWMVRSDGERTYAIGCNHESDAITATIPLPGAFEGVAVEVPTGREVSIADGKLTDRFDGFETHVYLLSEA